MIFGLFFSNLRGWFTRWRHNDVITTTKSVSFITWFLWCLFRVTFWIKQAFTKQWSEHHFSVPYHVTQCHMMETWWWRHRRCFRHVIMGSHDIPIYSILKCSNRTKFTCNFSLYMWEVASKIATLLRNVAFLFVTPLTTFVRVSFVQKQYDPQLTID